jgi:hypothetical protein
MQKKEKRALPLSYTGDRSTMMNMDENMEMKSELLDIHIC